MPDALSLVADTASWQQALLAVLVAFALSQAIAGVYARTHQGLSYSRSLVVTLVLSGIVAAVLMLAIGNSLARGIGIVGTLALIRFRTNLPDPLDMIFVFASFGAGIAAGTGNYATGVIGTAGFLAAAVLLQGTGFGSRRRFDGLARLQLPPGGEAEEALGAALREHCKTYAAVTLREAAQGRELERIYQVSFKEPGGEVALAARLAALPGASGVSVSMQEGSLEL